MTVFLVRHAQDHDNRNKILNGHRDEELTYLGRLQAYQKAYSLKKENIHIIYSSPLKRAHKTALIIGNTLKIRNIIIEKDLIERDFGILTGKPVGEICKYSNKTIKAHGIDYFIEAEGAESFPTLYKRAKNVLEKIMGNHMEKNILIVTHGDVGKMILASFYNWGWKKGLRALDFKNTDVLKLVK
jgi:probable phosphoglycerate mutase